jgi:hypothetical protein
MSKDKNSERIEQLKQIAVKGNAGVEQAKVATEQKKRREKREKAAPAKGAGRSVSTFRYPEDDRLILHLVGEMAAKGIRANDSQILRAGLLALDKLPLKDAVDLVKTAGENDKRKKG